MAKPDSHRNWKFIVYPESLPDDWLEIVENWGIQYAISPLHDLDVVTKYDVKDSNGYWTDSDIGKLKKPHYHIYLFFEQAKIYSDVVSLISVFGVKTAQYFTECRRWVRYLCHLDSKTKHHYYPNDIIFGNGYFDTGWKFIESEHSDDEFIDLCFEIISNYKVKYFCDFIDIVNSDFPVCKLVCRKHAVYFKNYIVERRYKYKDTGKE